MPTSSNTHIPVLLTPFMQVADPKPEHRWVDGTFGRGGHTRALLEAGCQVLALDRDAEAQAAADELAKEYPETFTWNHSNFDQIAERVSAHGWNQIDGVLLDLGVSSPQVDQAERGFSFQADGPLDMRMDQRQGITAADLVNERDADELARIIYEHGDERLSRRIARAIVARRESAPIRTTGELAAVVERAVGGRKAGRLHPATRTFQALRIELNQEHEALRTTLPIATRFLKPGGQFAVISFHSGEDRVVKNYFRKHASENQDLPHAPIPLPNPEHYFESKVIRHLPTEDEIASNPRSRSARLRIARRNSKPIAT